MVVSGQNDVSAVTLSMILRATYCPRSLASPRFTLHHHSTANPNAQFTYMIIAKNRGRVLGLSSRQAVGYHEKPRSYCACMPPHRWI